MLKPIDIKQYAQRKFPEFVAAYFRGESFFPLAVRFGQPSPSSPLGDLRREVDALWKGSHEFTGHGYHIHFEERRMRLHGDQRLPARVWFENEDDYLRFIGAVGQFARLKDDVAAMVDAAPELQPLVRDKARALISNLTPGDGRALGLAVAALHRRPRPNCFAREIALPGVSGKFIENNLSLIATILKEINSPAWIDAAGAHEQLGLKIPPRILRVMWLDGRAEDFGVSAARFTRPAEVENVLVVENLRSFLTLPQLPRTLAIFGEGRAAQTLGSLQWLNAVPLFYWGDIDPYGFNILSALRAGFSGVQSVLMNGPAFSRYQHLAALTPIPHFEIRDGVPIPDATWVSLAPEELAAANSSLAAATLSDGVMHAAGIEQEKIPQYEAAEEIRRVVAH